MADAQRIYKIVEQEVWATAAATGPWAGTPLDLRDGYVHLSTADQVAGTLAKHYPGRAGLLLLTVPVAALPKASLRWEPSRGGALFPHLYVPLDPAWVAGAHPLRVSDRGVHVLPF